MWLTDILRFTFRVTKRIGYDARNVEGQKENFDKKHAGCSLEQQCLSDAFKLFPLSFIGKLCSRCKEIMNDRMKAPGETIESAHHRAWNILFMIYWHSWSTGIHDLLSSVRGNSSTREWLLLTNSVGSANSRELVSPMELVRDTFPFNITFPTVKPKLQKIGHFISISRTLIFLIHSQIWYCGLWLRLLKYLYWVIIIKVSCLLSSRQLPICAEWTTTINMHNVKYPIDCKIIINSWILLSYHCHKYQLTLCAVVNFYVDYWLTSIFMIN